MPGGVCASYVGRRDSPLEVYKRKHVDALLHYDPPSVPAISPVLLLHVTALIHNLILLVSILFGVCVLTCKVRLV